MSSPYTPRDGVSSVVSRVLSPYLSDSLLGYFLPETPPNQGLHPAGDNFESTFRPTHICVSATEWPHLPALNLLILSTMNLAGWAAPVWTPSSATVHCTLLVHREQSGPKVGSYQDRCWVDSTSWVLLEGTMQSFFSAGRLQPPLPIQIPYSALAIPTSSFSSTFRPTMQLRDLGLCLGSSSIHQNTKLTLLRSPEVSRLRIQQLLWIKVLQLARVNARIPATNTMQRGSGLCWIMVILFWLNPLKKKNKDSTVIFSNDCLSWITSAFV